MPSTGSQYATTIPDSDLIRHQEIYYLIRKSQIRTRVRQKKLRSGEETLCREVFGAAQRRSI